MPSIMMSFTMRRATTSDTFSVLRDGPVKSLGPLAPLSASSSDVVFDTI